MNRREFLECATVLVSGLSASQLGFSLNSEQHIYLASAPDYNFQPIDYFTENQRRIVAAMSAVIIPKTDTPGAIEAGVPHFIELMVAAWFNEQEQAIFQGGLKDMKARIPQEHGQPFDQLDAKQQLAIMEAMEEAAGDSAWYQRGNVRRAFISDAPFICQVKELTAWGFFSSEVGSSQVLRPNMMPMKFDGNIPLSAEESSWTPFRF